MEHTSVVRRVGVGTMAEILAKPAKPCIPHLTTGCDDGECRKLHLDPSTPRAGAILEGLARAAAGRAAKEARAAAAAAAAEAAAAAAAEEAARLEAAAPSLGLLDELAPERVESGYVEDVYDAIAPHFSGTRHTPWPLVAAHVAGLGGGSLVADVGCGNGKYMHPDINPGIVMLGWDISANLLEEARANGKRNGDLVHAGALALPVRDAAFDHVISIAMIHHLRTQERRQEALREMLRVLAVGGTLLVTAWAMEQEGRVFDQQDTFVPWKLTKAYQGPEHDGLPRDHAGNVVYYRFYHLFVQGELQSLLSEEIDAGTVGVVDAAYDRDNWYVVFCKLS